MHKTDWTSGRPQNSTDIAIRTLVRLLACHAAREVLSNSGETDSVATPSRLSNGGASHRDEGGDE